MSVDYAPGYPIKNTPGSEGGDTVKQAVEKHISEFLKAYADINALYQQILLELQHANVDKVDGKDADNTANNIPLLDGEGRITNKVYTSSVETDSLKIGGEEIDALVSKRSTVTAGVVMHGSTIPIPDGFTKDQCKCIVSPKDLVTSTNSTDDYNKIECDVDTNMVVTCRVLNKSGGVVATGTARYLLIGLK